MVIRQPLEPCMLPPTLGLSLPGILISSGTLKVAAREYRDILVGPNGKTKGRGVDCLLIKFNFFFKKKSVYKKINYAQSYVTYEQLIIVNKNI